MTDEKNMEQQETAAVPQDTGADTPQEVKTFTQEEVNDIVEKRLNRERKKFSSVLNGQDPREAELEERERALTRKELRADARDLLNSKELPQEALELLDYTDKESCEESIEALASVVNAAVIAKTSKLLRGGPPMKKAPQEEPGADLRGAFGLR